MRITIVKYRILQIIFTIAVIISALKSVEAQSYIGVQIGVNSGKFSGDSPPNFRYSSKLLPNAGIVFDFMLKDDLYMNFTPSYLLSGSKLQYPYVNEDEEREYKDSIDLRINVVMLPVALKIISDNQRFQFSGGFELAIPTRLTADNGAQETNVSDQVNKLGVNMIFGIGYRVPVQRSLLVFNIGYSQGLTNLANNLEAEDSYLPRIRFTTFRLSTSWLLPVGQPKIN